MDWSHEGLQPLYFISYGKVNIVVNTLSWKAVSMGIIALLSSVTLDIKYLSNCMIRLDVSDSMQVLIYVGV